MSGGERSPLTRDEVRARWAASGLTVEALARDDFKRLRKKIDLALKGSGLIKDYRAVRTPKLTRTARGLYVQIVCRSCYFDRREAVTFNPDGFVGFAGWADDWNVQPILKAFCDWLEETSKPGMATAA